MNLAELFDRQQQDIERFKAMRDREWANLQKEQQSIFEAFGGREHLPEDLAKQVENQINKYRAEWSMYSGERHRAITQQHERQRQAITGDVTPVANSFERQQEDNDAISEKQVKLEKIIRQQQAIRNRKQQLKRK